MAKTREEMVEELAVLYKRQNEQREQLTQKEAEIKRLREGIKEIRLEVNRRVFGGLGNGLLANLPQVIYNLTCKLLDE